MEMEKKDNIDMPKKNLALSSKEKPLSPVTLRDLFLFKDEVLKEMRDYQSKINQSISKNFEEFKKLVEKSNDKLYNYEQDKASFMQQIQFVEEKNKIYDLIKEKVEYIKNQLNVNDLHIKNCQKELDDACFKYDRVIVNNLLIPGMVGAGCKFPYFKDYINDIQNQINNAVSQSKQINNNFTSFKSSANNQINQLNFKLKKLEIDSKQYTNEKTLSVEQKLDQNIETMNNRLNDVVMEYHKTNIELKKKLKEVKHLEIYLIEENRKINMNTLIQFEKIKKSFQKIKKSIVELTTLLNPASVPPGKNRFSKSLANNRQLIIQGFNNMVIGLMKEVTKENNLQLYNDLFPKKNVGSVIKKYIEGKIQAQDTKYEEKFGKNKISTFTDFLNSNSSKKSMMKNDDLSSIGFNSDFKIQGNSLDRMKKFNRKMTTNYGENHSNIIDIGFKKTINNKSSNTSKLMEIISEKNNLVNSDNKSNHIKVIKEENINNNNSKSLNSSIFDDFYDDINLDEQSNIIKKQSEGKSIKFYEDENNNKKFNKKFFRAATSNYDNKLFNYKDTSSNKDSFKLLLKAHENLKKQSFDRKKSFKNENTNNQSKNEDKSEKKIKSENKVKNDNSEENKIKYEYHKNNNIDTNDKKEEIKIIDGDSKENKDEIKNQSKFHLKENSNEIKNFSIKEEEITKSPRKEIIKNMDSSSPILAIKSKKMSNLKNATLKNQINQINQTNISIISNNFSPENQTVKFVKNNNKKNLTKKENIHSLSDNFNFKSLNTTNPFRAKGIVNNNQNVITSMKNKNRPISIKSSFPSRPLSKYKMKISSNMFNEDIFLNNDIIKNCNYCKDEDIIDRPLLINQTNFKVDNTKGSLENKLLELEYFTKKKLDELVREIKNFIPIHFNAYIKE